MDEPGLAFHFVFKLAGTPTGVAREHFYFARGGKGLAEFDEGFEGVAEIEVGHDTGAGQEVVRVEIAEGGKLHRAAEVKGLLFELLGDIGHDHFAEAGAAGPVEDEAERAFGVMLANEHHRALKKRSPFNWPLSSSNWPLRYFQYLPSCHLPEPICIKLAKSAKVWGIANITAAWR